MAYKEPEVKGTGSLQAEAKLKEAQAKLKEVEAKLHESEAKLKECEISLKGKKPEEEE
jgi:multidrug resistance efflux pump